ncbi:MAG: BrxA/BrxB family bacilliredoxin [Rhodothermaceae bacterium]|nr:BrxA/BrxB family bacilliredoxin [Rhodothermaceae bacterium]
MPYPEPLVRPMREELTRLGVQELLDITAVDDAFEAAETETTLLIVNSVCGCAAANARPAVAMAQQSPVQPNRYVTVFAGQDLEATARAREYLRGIPPSSPFMALLKDGDPVFILERRHIEGRSASAIAMDLVNAYQKYCGTSENAEGGPERPEMPEMPQSSNGLPPTFKSIR